MVVTILDGGLGQELIARSGKATGLWSTQALLDAPEIVRGVHDDFFAAGAVIATADSYGLLPDRLEPVGLEDQLHMLIRRACEIAADAREAHGSGQVAGSLGPQGFSYQPDKAPPAEVAAEVYADIVRTQAPLVDFHIAETMASVDQAKGALMGMAVSDKPAWLAVSVDDADGTRLRSGEPLTDLLPLIEAFQPAAVLVNCSIPEAVSVALPHLADCGRPLGAYANGFTGIHAEFNKVGATVDILKARTDLGPEAYADFAADWIAAGATLIGGCCEVGPAHIAELKRRFAA